ncbi:16S rRNA (adenine(1518)-N(6)/adenine(1519)-N(6))-dimethyltransferase RsmA [Oceanicaulis sp. AH-315-P02]|nr:16S rRNA (adenine(1518)-N(6)/adenine(1519)-N(6))-dimethyltransferase RsmA [Robiginitomaculum sp.]MBN4047868.1 16S rRNA (adenine(1518)-N(6)/adenine(1519)-N(6))-dimethyltransferase RsmA [Oceanicaulis sp. AH-315-P02]
MTKPELPPIRNIVEKYGLKASKKFGQHFLFDLNLTEKIVRLSDVKAGDLVFEIGPGPGGLTRPLLAAKTNVHVIETDQRFLPALAELGEFYDDKLSIHLGDALEFDLNELANSQKFKVVSNLPYNVGTALLIKWLTSDILLWQSLTLMFQLEVAQRITAKVGSKNYGRLSILCAAIAKTELVMQVPASVFTPPPKVESAIVHLTPLPENQRFGDLQTLAKITAMAFGQKRKMLRASLKPLSVEIKQDISTWLQAIEIDPTTRPETLTPTQFMNICTTYTSSAQVA